MSETPVTDQAARAADRAAPGPGPHCPICGSAAGQREFAAREMMYGLRDRFIYAECSACGCLHLIDPPANPARYYPPDYYAFHAPPTPSGLRGWLRRKCAGQLVGRRSLAGALAFRIGRPLLGIAAVGRTGVRPADAILDVGSGAGDVLAVLEELGYRNLTGIDPYIEADFVRGEHIRIRKAYLSDMDGVFDLVIMNHSLEHMPDHAAVLRAAGRLTAPQGSVLIRTPLAARSWREYGADWVELDAPRHLIVHSERSIRLLAARTGFDVVDVTYDSTSAELWGSAQYRNDIPLLSPRSYLVDPRHSMFPRRRVWQFERRVRRMNRAREAGRASIILRPAASSAA